MTTRAARLVRKFTAADRRFMALALDLARKGCRRASPNPMVGCVIVKDGTVIGAGYHEYFGGPHAEVNALASAGKSSRGGTMYVTLEPCNHWGKTPPCTDAIVAAGITRVVAAMEDPNPRIAGKGSRRLREEGIAVSVGVRRAEAAKLNRPYIQRFKQKRMQLVTVKAAMTLDGKIATRTGISKWITSPSARNYVHRLRSTYDAILVGVGTVTRDNPSLTSHGKGRNPVRVIIDPALRIPAESRVFDDEAPTIVIHGSGASPARVRQLRKKKALLIPLPQSREVIEFRAIIKKLAELDLRRVLIEGGGVTIARAIEAGVVNDVIFFIAPKIVGGRDAITPVEGIGIEEMDAALPVRGWKITRIGRDLLVSGSVERPCSRVL